MDFTIFKLRQLNIFFLLLQLVFLKFNTIADFKNSYKFSNILTKFTECNIPYLFINLQSANISCYTNFNLRYFSKLYSLKLTTFSFFKNTIYYTNNFILTYLFIKFLQINKLSFKNFFLMNLISYKKFPIKKNYFSKVTYKYNNKISNINIFICTLVRNLKISHTNAQIPYNLFFLNKFFFNLSYFSKSSIFGYLKLFNFLNTTIGLVNNYNTVKEISMCNFLSNTYSSIVLKKKTNFFKANVMSYLNVFNDNNFLYFQAFDTNFITLFKYIYSIFLQNASIVQISVFELSLKFTFLLWSKNSTTFANYLDYILFKLNKTEQSKLINLFNSFVEDTFLQILKLVNVFGFYMRLKGKVTSFAGGRKKSYIVKYGKYSRSSRLFRIHFFQKNTSNLTGAVGINISISYV